MSIETSFSDITNKVDPSRITEINDVYRKIVLLGIGLIVAYLALTPLAFVIWTSLWTGDIGTFEGTLTIAKYQAVYADPAIISTIFNTLLVALGTLVLSLLLGLTFSICLARTNVATKGAIETILLTPYAVSGFLYAFMYVFTFGPRIGWVTTGIQDIFGLSDPLFNLYTVWGIVFVTSITIVPSVYLLTVPALRNMDPAFAEAGRIHGASPFTMVRTIMLPLIKPAISSASLITFIRGIGIFATVAILGVPVGIDVLATEIWKATNRNFPPDYAAGAALAATVILITAILIYYHRKITERKEDFMTITGSGYQPRTWNLGKWKWPLTGTLWCVLFIFWILPIILIVLVSFHSAWAGEIRIQSLTLMHYQQMFTMDAFTTALVNSLIIAIGGGIAGTLLVVLFSYYVERTSLPFRGVADFISLTPLAAPGVILGVSVLVTYLWIGKLTPINLYGSLTLLTIGMITLYLPTTTRMASGSIVQIHTDLEEAARISGAGWGTQMKEIFLPLFKGTIGAVFFYLAIHMVRHLSVAIMLYTSSSIVLSVLVFNQWEQVANLEMVAALSTVLMAGMFGFLSLLRFFGFEFFEVA